MEGREWGTENRGSTGYSQRQQLCGLLTEFEDLFQAKPGKTTLAEHRIEVGNDLTKGYWQVPVREEDKEKTAFITPTGLFQSLSLRMLMC